MVTKQGPDRSWAMLAYRLPREPSTPRIALWRKLKRLGVAQLSDGLVALPLDSRNREQLEWLAEEVGEAGGEASIWLADAATASQTRSLASGLASAIAEEYERVAREAELARTEDSSTRSRTLARLRREMRRIRARDYFPPRERTNAEHAMQALAAADEVHA